MRVSVFGLGYVGAVTSACLAKDGNHVIGVDVNPVKLDIINEGRSPIIEDGMDALIAEQVEAARLTTTGSAEAAVAESEIAIICVGTPSQSNGSLDTTHVRAVAEEVGNALRDKNDRFTVVVRSTVLPGTTRDVVVRALEEASGKTAGRDFGVAFNPEFLREGSSIFDYYNPPKIVVGATDEETEQLVLALFAHLDAPRMTTEIETAELVKYVDNTWHALKVGFANEVGRVAKALELDGHDIMDIFVADTKLNISPKYLLPGFAFGGSCLPKDVRALRHKARSLDLELPIINSILRSNERQIEAALERIVAMGEKKVSLLGLSFKAGVDDLRESPNAEIAERLIGKGFDLRVYDPAVRLASLVGANKEYILNQIPHLSSLLVENLDEAMAHGQIVVIANGNPEFAEAVKLRRPDQRIVDLVRIERQLQTGEGYDGLSW